MGFLNLLPPAWEGKTLTFYHALCGVCGVVWCVRACMSTCARVCMRCVCMRCADDVMCADDVICSCM